MATRQRRPQSGAGALCGLDIWICTLAPSLALRCPRHAGWMCGAPVPSLAALARRPGRLPDVAQCLVQRFTDIRLDRTGCNAYSLFELAYIDAAFDAPLLLQGRRHGKKAIEALLYCRVDLRFPSGNVGKLEEVAHAFGCSREPDAVAVSVSNEDDAGSLQRDANGG